MNILTHSNAIPYSMFNFCKIFTKNAITFDQTEIERKKLLGGGDKFSEGGGVALKKTGLYRVKNINDATHFIHSQTYNIN